MIELTLATTAGLLLQVEAVKQPPTAPPQRLDAFILTLKQKPTGAGDLT
jgi:hypothetical protein